MHTLVSGVYLGIFIFGVPVFPSPDGLYQTTIVYWNLWYCELLGNWTLDLSNWEQQYRQMYANKPLLFQLKIFMTHTLFSTFSNQFPYLIQLLKFNNSILFNNSIYLIHYKFLVSRYRRCYKVGIWHRHVDILQVDFCCILSILPFELYLWWKYTHSTELYCKKRFTVVVIYLNVNLYWW